MTNPLDYMNVPDSASDDNPYAAGPGNFDLFTLLKMVKPYSEQQTQRLYKYFPIDITNFTTAQDVPLDVAETPDYWVMNFVVLPADTTNISTVIVKVGQLTNNDECPVYLGMKTARSPESTRVVIRGKNNHLRLNIAQGGQNGTPGGTNFHADVWAITGYNPNEVGIW